MRPILFLLSIIMVILTSTSCTYLGKTIKDKKETKKETTKKEEVKKEEIKKQKERYEKVNLRQKIIDLLDKQEYLQALNVINKEVNKKDLPEIYFEKEYIIAINELIGSGEESFRNEDYEHAGRIFRNVLEHYPREESLIIRLKRPPEVIESYIGICSEELMDKGLLEYRDGNLANAIGIWSEILLFNPDFPDAKKAIETATTQLKNLRSIENGGR